MQSKHFTSKVKMLSSSSFRDVYVPFYSNKVKDKEEKQVTHTYPLIKAKGFMEATK